MSNFFLRNALPIKLVLILHLLSFQLWSQCDNNSEWGGTIAPVGAAEASISNCNYAGEFAFVSDVQAGSVYVVTSSNCSDYISLYDPSGNMVDHGNTPLEFTAALSGDFAAHFNTDASCGTEGSCRATAISCITCGAVAGCTDPVATNYDAAATFDDCSCIVPSLTNDECAAAISLDPYVNTDGECTLNLVSPYSGATSSTGEVAPSAECSDGDSSPKDVWFNLTVPASGAFTVQFTETPGFSSIMECYTGTCGNLNAYTPILCNNETKRTFMDLPVGDVVLLRVWDYGSNDVGNHGFCVKAETLGCTDPLATNYDPDASLDDGTCEYPSASKPCVATDLELNAACVIGDNTNAFMEPGEPAGTCFSGTNHAVWFKFIAEADLTNISTDFSGYSSNDTEVVIYASTDCTDYGTFVEIDCDQDGGDIVNYNSIISGVPTNVGQTYYVQVSGWNGTQGTFCIEATSAAANNEICGAAPVQCGETITASTANYSLSTINIPSESCAAGALTAPNAFYEYVGTGDDVTISLCNSSYDTRLDVFCRIGGDCSTTPDYVCIAGNDDNTDCAAGTTSEVTFATMANSKYYIMVHGYSNNTGSFEMSLDCTPFVVPPANQDCDNNGLACRQMGSAFPVDVDEVCNYTYGNNENAAQAIFTPPCASSAYQSITDVWYRFNSGDYNGYELELIEYTAIDVRHALYEVCGGEAMFCDVNTFYNLEPNTEYFLQVFTQKGNEGDFEMCIKPVEVCAFLTIPSGTEVDVNTTISWSEAYNAIGYELMIGSTPGSDDFMPLTDVGDVLSYTPATFDFNTTYYITVVPYNSNGPVNTCPSIPITTKCPLIQTDVVEMANASCFGSLDAAIDLEVGGGEGPYNFEWNGPGGFTNANEDLVQITGGIYTVAIIDMNNGCIVSDTFTVLPLEGMTAISNIVDEACGNDGAAEIVVFGGAEPYTYQWSTGSTSAASTNLPSGNYEVTVTDNNGCTQLFDDIIVDDGGELSASVVDITGVGCGSSSGSITISPVTGTSPYDYAWTSSTGAVTGSITAIDGSYAISPLPVGSYTVTITDVNGCVGFLNNLPVEIAEEIVLDIDEIAHPDCYSNGNGIITISAVVGQAPFQFIWSNGEVVSNSDGTEQLAGIVGGNYSVTVTDVNGCTGVSPVITVVEPAPLNVVVHEVQAPVCFGESSGTILIDVAGGSGPYTYAWSNGYTTEDLTGVGAGNYMLTVTDANDCSSTSPVIIVANPTAIEVNLNSIEHNACFGENSGSINTGIFGGAPPYDIQWNNGSNNANLDYLTGGDYQVTIVDQAGCEFISPVYTVNEPEAAIEVELDEIIDNECNGFDVGSINVSVQGGTAPYTYNWSNGTDTPNNENLTAGNYLLTITDDNNCKYISDIFYVSEPEVLEAITSTTPDMNETGNGTATVEVTGGTMPYTYQWDANTDNQTTATATDLSAAIYSVTITDANGCMFVTSVAVSTEYNSAANEISNLKRLELSPNPTRGEAQLLVELSEVEQIQVEVFDVSGKQVLMPQIYQARQLLTIIDLNEEASGVYLVKVSVGLELKTLQLVKR